MNVVNKERQSKQSLSVAMATYNGACFLKKQLESIATQNRPPDELVVCDDNSSDNTLELLEDFKARVEFPVFIYENETTLGVTKNFEKAIKLCQGDIIALSDQDDVWCDNKLYLLEKKLRNSQKTGYIFSNAKVVNEKLETLGYSLWERVKFTDKKRSRFKNGNQLAVLLGRNVVTGATMAFRSKIIDLIVPIPSNWIHDEWIALIATGAGYQGRFIERPLIAYRQHSQQKIGARKAGIVKRIYDFRNTTTQTYQLEKQKYNLAKDRLEIANEVPRESMEFLEEKIQHLETRAYINKSNFVKSIVRIVTEFLSGGYGKFSNGWQSCVKDILSVFF